MCCKNVLLVYFKVNKRRKQKHVAMVTTSLFTLEYNLKWIILHFYMELNIGFNFSAGDLTDEKKKHKVKQIYNQNPNQSETNPCLSVQAVDAKL